MRCLRAISCGALTDRFFDEYYFPFNPTAATSAGIHKYDGQLEDYSKAGVTTRASPSSRNSRPSSPSCRRVADRDLVLSYIRAGLLELETVRSWEKNPDIYSSGITSSAFTIMSRKFAPPEVRLQVADRRASGRCRKVLADARANLKNPPKIYTEIAHRTASRHHRLFRERRAAGVQERDGPETAGGFQAVQRRRDRRAEAITRRS